MKKSVREAKPERLMRWSSFCGVDLRLLVVFCGWFCFLCVWIFRKRYDVLGKLLKGLLIVKEVIFRCCNGVLCAVCMGFWGYRACFVGSLVRISTPILEGIYVLHHVKGVVEMVILWVND